MFLKAIESHKIKFLDVYGLIPAELLCHFHGTTVCDCQLPNCSLKIGDMFWLFSVNINSGFCKGLVEVHYNIQIMESRKKQINLNLVQVLLVGAMMPITPLSPKPFTKT